MEYFRSVDRTYPESYSCDFWNVVERPQLDYRTTERDAAQLRVSPWTPRTQKAPVPSTGDGR